MAFFVIIPTHNISNLVNSKTNPQLIGGDFYSAEAGYVIDFAQKKINSRIPRFYLYEGRQPGDVSFVVSAIQAVVRIDKSHKGKIFQFCLERHFCQLNKCTSGSS
jgi:hypothetical protein